MSALNSSDSLSAISTGDLVRKVVESGLSAKYEDAVELVRRGEEAIPYLSKYVREDKYWYADENGNFIADSYAPISALHLLGAIGSTAGLDDVLYVLYERVDDLGDWLTEGMASILASFGSKALPKLKECAGDRRLDMYARIDCIRAMVVIARREPSFRQEIVEFMKSIIQRKREDSEFLGFTIWSLAEMKDRSALGTIEEAFRRKSVDKSIIKLDDVLEIYGEEGDEDYEYHYDDKNPLDYFLESNLEELRVSYANWLSGRKLESEKGQLDEEEAEAILDSFDEADLSELEKEPERNDPCPCGSGLKYKRCCLRFQMERKRWDPVEGKLRAMISEFFSSDRFVEDMRVAASIYGRDLDDPNERALFYDWFIHDYIIPSEGMSVIRIFLNEHRKDLTDQEAKILEAWANSTFRFLKVLDVRFGVGFTASDLFGSDGSSSFFFSTSGSRNLVEGDVIFVRPYPTGSIMRLASDFLIFPKRFQKKIEEFIELNCKNGAEAKDVERGSQFGTDKILDNYLRTESLSIIKFLTTIG